MKSLQLNGEGDPSDGNNGRQYVENAGCINTQSGEQVGFSLSSASYTPEAREAFRRQLKYYFMNPIDKWRSKKKFPWKILLQMVKLFIVTMQVYIIGKEMSRFITHQANMKITFRELFLHNWDPVREVMTYPPAAGPFAVYTKTDLYENIDYAIKSFSNLTKNGLGSFAYESEHENEVSPIYLHIQHFSIGEANPFNFSYHYNNNIIVETLSIDPPYLAGDVRWKNFSIEKYLSDKDIHINFDSLIKLKLTYNLRTIYLDELEAYNHPKCYTVQVIISFDNYLHDGQVTISLGAKMERRHCNGNLDNGFGSWTSRRTLTCAVIFSCFLSAMLCMRSLLKALVLRIQTIQFFKDYYNLDLCLSDRCEFVDVWIIMILVNDILLIIGSGIKLCITVDYSSSSSSDYSVMFGLGILLTYCGLLRYISFFHKFNIVILTVRKAFPDIIKFAICAILLYIGFCLCGWIVLGPHHLKFRTPSQTSECLFSLLNGDDMFATFATLDTKDPLIWWFTRVYLYSFISLFIYVVLSLFISIIMDAWDVIKSNNGDPAVMTDLHRFISECSEDVYDEIYQDERGKPFMSRVKSFFRLTSSADPLI